jgi:hypothetical protein
LIDGREGPFGTQLCSSENRRGGLGWPDRLAQGRTRNLGGRRGGNYPDADPNNGQNNDDEHGDRVVKLAHHAARNEYKIVLAIMPFPANPMDTNTVFERPGTVNYVLCISTNV